MKQYRIMYIYIYTDVYINQAYVDALDHPFILQCPPQKKISPRTSVAAELGPEDGFAWSQVSEDAGGTFFSSEGIEYGINGNYRWFMDDLYRWFRDDL